MSTLIKRTEMIVLDKFCMCIYKPFFNYRIKLKINCNIYRTLKHIYSMLTDFPIKTSFLFVCEYPNIINQS